MKVLSYEKDGGIESRVSGLYLMELKSLFSIVLLRFADGSREAYHSHAFNALSWVLSGRLDENMLEGPINTYMPSCKPVITRRTDFHKVSSIGTTWVLSFRGPWIDKWREFLPILNKFITLTHGRKIVGEIK